MVAYVEMDVTVSVVYFMEKPQHVPEGLMRVMLYLSLDNYSQI